MEQEGVDGRRGEMNKQVQIHPPQPPQKCPRCDSFNTKFCYYNNYSLSQPRYFCKSCRRYWTQGGTLRNVPVGGGCRKGKRAKNSSSTSSGNSSLSQTPVLSSAQQQTMALALMTKDASFSSALPFYQGGGGVGGVGYMSSFAGFNNNNQMNLPSSTHSNPFENVGGHSNLGLLQGFNVAAAALGNSTQGQNRPSQFFPMGMFTSEQQQGLNLIPPCSGSGSGVGVGALTHHENWTQSFMNNNSGNNNRVNDPSLWSTISTTTSIGGANNSDRNLGGGSGGGASVGGSSSLAPNQWPDLSGFNPSQ
ncbi:uncharacterized protein [Cicer arietinum]|uniref:Dof zinc finger protein n=1 Tax=Cicer arietinum TaxID=3827 RepID=A0A1S2X9S5_CICAR|nr:dof zinc finger protein DOF5.3-like [Cicer arietinum]